MRVVGSCKGDVISDVIIGAMVIVLIIIPVSGAVIERYILAARVEYIQDAVDLANLAAYTALDASVVSEGSIDFSSITAQRLYMEFLALNLGLNTDLTPGSVSVADSQVVVKSLIIYTSGFPLICPAGREISRPTIHSVVTVPVRPRLFTGKILTLLGVPYIELNVHTDTEIPVNN